MVRMRLRSEHRRGLLCPSVGPTQRSRTRILRTSNGHVAWFSVTAGRPVVDPAFERCSVHRGTGNRRSQPGFIRSLHKYWRKLRNLCGRRQQSRTEPLPSSCHDHCAKLMAYTAYPSVPTTVEPCRDFGEFRLESAGVSGLLRPPR